MPFTESGPFVNYCMVGHHIKQTHRFKRFDEKNDHATGKIGSGNKLIALHEIFIICSRRL